MAKINPQLLNAIMDKTGLSRPQVYVRIKQTANRDTLPRHLAAIKVGADVGVTINKYADDEELTQLRQAGSPVAPPTGSVSATSAGPRPTTKTAGKTGKKPGKKVPNQVFVVHGRDGVAKDAMFAFLRSVGVKPIEWSQAVRMTNKPTPYIGEILDAAFSNARAVVVLLTPDDIAQLRDDLVSKTDPAFEKRLTGQARPNVLFEAGMAFSSHPDKTVMVQLGNIRPFSDIAGRHVIHMSGDAENRKDLTDRLKFAGCDVDTTGTDWLSAGDFTDPEARTPVKRLKKMR
ncbi:MAG: hypothetical protein HJJLKODD_01999 [Phycisphaerae bacterium]|nr:hypothetical protein [Phycisphaerae bacterium]